MPTQILLPGPLRVEADPGSHGVLITGSGNQWADNSDATSGLVYRDTGSLSWGYVTANFDKFTAASPSEVTAVGFTMRAAFTSYTTGAPDPLLTLEIDAPVTLFEIVAYLPGIVNDGAIHNYSYTISSADYTRFPTSGVHNPVDLATQLAANNCKVRPFPTVNDTECRIYEMAIVVTYGGVTYERVHPRDDGLGTSTSPRVWPAPSSQQFSNRQVGGYY